MKVSNYWTEKPVFDMECLQFGKVKENAGLNGEEYSLRNYTFQSTT
jgi:hypothetical protein